MMPSGLRKLGAVVATAVCFAPLARAAAPSVHFLAAGPQTLFQTLEMAAVNDLAPQTPTVKAGGTIHHYSFRSVCPGSLTCETVLHDTRTSPASGPIPDETTTMWVVWTCLGKVCTGKNAVDVWAYHRVDSVVAVRAILARDVDGSGGVLSQVDFGTTNNPVFAGMNVVNPSFFLHGDQAWAASDTSCPASVSTCDAEFIPTDVWVEISGDKGIAVNVGMSELRPEDAKAAVRRANGPTNNSVSLGYGTVGSQLVGSAIQSYYSTVESTPVTFGLPGFPDPFTGGTVPSSMTVIPIGQLPIVFIANRSNPTGLGAPDIAASKPFAYTNLVDTGGVQNPLSLLFSGYDCAGDSTAFSNSTGTKSLTAAGVPNFPVSLIQRDPLSGAMNVIEWSEFRTSTTWNVNPAPYPYIVGTAAGGSQEYDVDPVKDNPLNLKCAAGPDGTVRGIRQRALGVGELIEAVKATNDSLGYIFFNFGSFSAIAKSPLYGYLNIDGVDPIFASYYGHEVGQPGNGQLPACRPGACNAVSIWNNPLGSFPNLRNGTYRAWSTLRGICDTADGNCTADPFGASALIAALQADVGNSSLPRAVADFLPISQAQYVHSHFNLLPETQHRYLHFFDLPEIAPDSANNTLDVAMTALENGGDAGGCILPLKFASVGSTGNYANDTILSITKAQNVAPAGTVQYTYSLVSGTPLTAVAAKGKPLTVSIAGFVSKYDGVFNVNLGNVTATTFQASNPAAGGLGPGSIIPPAAGNGSAGNGNAGGGTVVQCFLP